MNRVQRLCLVFFLTLIGFFARGQKTINETTFYREDQFYFGLNYLVLQSTADTFEQQGLSSQFQIGILRDIPLHPNGRWAIALGVGYERSNLRSNSQWEDTTLNYTTASYRAHSYQSMSFPLEIRWRSSTPSQYAFWRIYSGVKWQRNWALGSLPQGVLKPWLPSVYAAIGYNTWNVYVGASLQPIYEAHAVTKNNQLRSLALGLIFYLL